MSLDDSIRAWFSQGSSRRARYINGCFVAQGNDSTALPAAESLVQGGGESSDLLRLAWRIRRRKRPAEQAVLVQGLLVGKDMAGSVHKPRALQQRLAGPPARHFHGGGIGRGTYHPAIVGSASIVFVALVPHEDDPAAWLEDTAKFTQGRLGVKPVK